jgi:hypothetical protein
MDDERPDRGIEAIREKIRNERAIVAALQCKIRGDLKQFLKPALSLLNDAEGWLSPEVLVEQPRSPTEWAKWLTFVSGIVDDAASARQRVEEYARKLGLDACVIGCHVEDDTVARPTTSRTQ